VRREQPVAGHPNPGERIEWIQVLRMERGEFSQEKMNQGYPEGAGHPGGRQRLYARRVRCSKASTQYDAQGGAREGRHLHADRLHAVREAAVRQGLPGAHHLPRGRWPGGDRLQLVHRLQDVHERLPLLGAPVQPHHPVLPEEEMNPVHALPGQPPAHARASLRSATGACSAPVTAATRPASRSARSVRASSAICSTRKAKVSKVLARKNVFRLKAGTRRSSRSSSTSTTEEPGRVYPVFVLRLRALRAQGRHRSSMRGWACWRCSSWACSTCTYLQNTEGLIVTGLTSQIHDGLYLANLVFLVGVAAGAVTIVFPAYVYHHEGMHKVTVLGEMLAISAVIMVMMFVFAPHGPARAACGT